MGVIMLMTLSCHSQNNTKDNQAVWDRSFGGADKSYDTELLTLRDKIAPKFQTLEFEDSLTGKTMIYNLFTPKDYDENISYPLVQFIADASTVGKGFEAPLKQGYGGIIWATDESQSENPCFVLVPSFLGPERAVNDEWETSDEVDMAYRLLNTVITDYNIDKDRIYTTGQSMGAMISLYFNAMYPNLFAASIFVGGQWDVNVLQPLIEKTFFYIVSAGDQKASNGMREVGDLLTENGVNYGFTEFSAKLPQVTQYSNVEDLIAEGNSINFIHFTPNTVTPESVSGSGSEHMYSFDYAYKLKPVRDWLFRQQKDY